MAIDLDRAVPDVVEAGEQAGHGGLAGPGPPDDGDGLTRWDVQVEVGEHQLLGLGRVGEVHMTEADVAGARSQVDGAGPVGDGRLLVEDLVDPAGRSRSALAHHDQHAEHHERCLQHEQVGVEGQDGPDAE